MAKRRKIGGEPRKLFKTELQVYEQLLKKIELGRTLTEIEFSVCSPELRAIYCAEKAKRGELDDFLVNFCDQKIIDDCVKYCMKCGKSISKAMFDRIVDEDLMQQYLLSLIEDSHALKDYELNRLNHDYVKLYWEKCIDKQYETFEDFYIPFEYFKLISEAHKIKYIFNSGLINLRKEIVEWFSLWKQARGRDVRIDMILTDNL